MNLPDNLGQIEHLRNHLPILEMLIQRSAAKSLEPFILNFAATTENGGFFWTDSYEELGFWDEILLEKNTAPFYVKYPDKKPTDNPYIRCLEEQKIKDSFFEAAISLIMELRAEFENDTKIGFELTKKVDYFLNQIQTQRKADSPPAGNAQKKL